RSMPLVMDRPCRAARHRSVLAPGRLLRHRLSPRDHGRSDEQCMTAAASRSEHHGDPSGALMSTSSDHFPTEVAGLPEARAPELIDLADGAQVDMRIAPVAKQLGDAKVRMLAYNGSIPGPTLRVQEGSEVVVNIENQGDVEATVHWHGLRLENRYDG